MDINQSSLSRYKSNKSGSTHSSYETKIDYDTYKVREKTYSSFTQSPKQLDLKEGQVIKGQIIDYRYNEVSVQLEPGKQVIKAHLTGDISLSIGQEAKFQVTEEATDQLVLKYLPGDSSTPSDSTIQKALSASNFPLTERNRAIVSELLNHRMPVDKQTLQTLIKISHMNREASPLTLILMYKNNIPMTTANINQFEAYQKGSHQLLNDIHTITKTISELLKQPEAILVNPLATPQTSDNYEAIGLMKQSSDFVEQPIISQYSQASSSEDVENRFLNSNQNLQKVVEINGKLIELLNNTNDTTSNQSTIAISDILNPEELSLLFKTTLQNNSDSSGIMQQIQDGSLSVDETIKLLQNIYTDNSDMVDFQTLSNVIKDANPSLEPIILKLMEQITPQNDNLPPISDLLTQAERNDLLKQLATYPDKENIFTQIRDGSASFNRVLNYIQENIVPMDKEAAASILQSPEYTKLLEEAFHNKWTLTPEKAAKKLNVTESFNHLQKDMEELRKLVKVSESASQELRLEEPVKNIQDNLKFMKDLNELFTYLQLPLQLKDRDLHSDLYVFARKNAPKDNQDNLSVLLHLDMDNLGPLNVHIQMNNKSIKAKFDLEDNEARQLIEKNLNTLTEVLKKKGYDLHAEMDDAYKKPDFTKDFVEDNSPDNLIRRYNFDIRT